MPYFEMKNILFGLLYISHFSLQRVAHVKRNVAIIIQKNIPKKTGTYTAFFQDQP